MNSIKMRDTGIFLRHVNEQLKQLNLYLHDDLGPEHELTMLVNQMWSKSQLTEQALKRLIDDTFSGRNSSDN